MLVKVDNGKGALSLAATVVRWAVTVPEPKFTYYKGRITKLTYSHIHKFYNESMDFLVFGKLLDMTCDSMEYDRDKFRRQCIDTLEKNYEKYWKKKDLYNPKKCIQCLEWHDSIKDICNNCSLNKEIN